MIMIDMKMPKCCIGCPILRESAWWGTYCPFVCEENNVNIKERTDRPSECPLKEIIESDDCVSRQAAINAIQTLIDDILHRFEVTAGVEKRRYMECLQIIRELPPVKPEQYKEDNNGKNNSN